LKTVQMKIVVECACQPPTEDVGSNEDIERWTQACAWGGRRPWNGVGGFCVQAAAPTRKPPQIKPTRLLHPIHWELEMDSQKAGASLGSRNSACGGSTWQCYMTSLHPWVWLQDHCESRLHSSSSD
jgi:hypothetical protein